MATKDRIDIQVTVESLDPAIEEALSHIGYQQLEYLTDHPPIGIEYHASDWIKWMFKPPDGQRPTNLNDRRANQRYALLFRDYLRNHANTVQAYAELKRRLTQNLVDPDTYPDVKDPAVDLIYFAAEDWAATILWQPGPSDA